MTARRGGFHTVACAQITKTRSRHACSEGNVVREVARLGLLDNIPIEFDATREGPRSISWRGDKPAELKWVEALDGGDPKNNPDTAPRDAVYSIDLSAGDNSAEPRRIAATDLRCGCSSTAVHGADSVVCSAKPGLLVRCGEVS